MELRLTARRERLHVAAGPGSIRIEEEKQEVAMAVLVAYASALGSTREIAPRVAARLAAVQGEVECRSVEQTGPVSGYEAVVVGSAIHNQAWLAPASDFLAQHAPELAERPVW